MGYVALILILYSLFMFLMALRDIYLRLVGRHPAQLQEKFLRELREHIDAIWDEEVDYQMARQMRRCRMRKEERDDP